MSLASFSRKFKDTHNNRIEISPEELQDPAVLQYILRKLISESQPKMLGMERNTFKKIGVTQVPPLQELLTTDTLSALMLKKSHAVDASNVNLIHQIKINLIDYFIDNIQENENASKLIDICRTLIKNGEFGVYIHYFLFHIGNKLEVIVKNKPQVNNLFDRIKNELFQTPDNLNKFISHILDPNKSMTKYLGILVEYFNQYYLKLTPENINMLVTPNNELLEQLSTTTYKPPKGNISVNAAVTFYSDLAKNIFD